MLTRIAGTGEAGFSGDGGPATAARINFVHSASPTADGGYVLADTGNHRIRYVSASGVITTVAGNGVQGYSGDGGPATAAAINAPRGVTALADGSFLIPDSSNHRVRKVSPSGVITVAGTGVQGFSGDGGPATAANLSVPFGVAPTADGGFLIVDVGNQRIRKVSAAGSSPRSPGRASPAPRATAAPPSRRRSTTCTTSSNSRTAASSSPRPLLTGFAASPQTARSVGFSPGTASAPEGRAEFAGDGGAAASRS